MPAGQPSPPRRSRLAEELDNPIERLKLIGEDDAAIAAYLDSIEVSSPREREMMRELARTQPLRDTAAFPAAHRNLVEALESLARHGYRGTRAGRRLGPLRPAVRFGVELVARYLVVSFVRSVSTSLRNLYGLREIQALPETVDRTNLHRARTDAERMVDALQTREIGVPTFLIGGALLPVIAALGRLTGLMKDPLVATGAGIAGALVSIVAAWFVLRGAAMASRRIRLATQPPLVALWAAIGSCGSPPKPQIRTFVVAAVLLTVGAWVILPAVVALALLL